MQQLFVAWVPFQRRTISLQTYFGYDLEFLTLSYKQRWLRPWEYVLKSLKTLSLFLQKKPQVIWVQLPPNPLLHLAFLYKRLLNPQTLIVADCHNATFRSPWIKIPGSISLLNQSDVVLVHNDWVEQQAKELGITTTNLHVLEDPPAIVEDDSSAASNGKNPEKTAEAESSFTAPWVMFPCSFNVDEPIEAVLGAARLAPEITFVLTGKPSRAKGIHDLSDIPDNVRLAGFLPKEDFDRFLLHTNAILGLTKLDGIQLSVANEAISAGKPMVLSNTNTLKKLFYKGAVFVDSGDAQALADGCRMALSQQQELEQAIQDLKSERRQHWLDQAAGIKILKPLVQTQF